MFNLQGSEVVIILLLALVVLGPEKLPEAMRRMGQFVAEVRKIGSGFQDEFRAVVEEPMAEVRNTADMLRDSADFTKLANGERAEKHKSAEMTDASDNASREAAPPFIADPSADEPDVGIPDPPAIPTAEPVGGEIDPSEDTGVTVPEPISNQVAFQNSSAGLMRNRQRRDAEASEAGADDTASVDSADVEDAAS